MATTPGAAGPAVRARLRPVVPARVEVLPGVGHLELPAAPATAERILDWLETLP